MNARSFVRNFASLLTGRIGGDFFIFLLIVTIARVFGPEGNGSYGVAMSIAGFFVAFADLGLRQYTIKHLSGEGVDAGFLSRVWGLRLILTAACSVVLLILAAALPWPVDERLVLVAIGLQQIFRCLAEGISAVFVAREQSLVPGLLELVCKGLGAGGAVALIFADLPLGMALMMLPASELLNIVLAGLWVRHHTGSLRPSFGGAAYRQTLRDTLPYATASLLQQFASRIDVLFVGLLLGTAAAGIYHAAFRLVVLALFVPYFASYAILPIFTRVYAHSRADARHLYKRILGGTLVLGLPAVVGLAWIAEPLILTVFGEDFRASVPVMQWLAGLILLVWLSENLGIIMLATDQVAAVSRHKAWAALVNVTGNLVLLPTVGIAGAAYASLASEVLLIVLHVAALAPQLGTPWPLRRLGIAVLGSFAFCSVLWMLPTQQLYVTIPIAGLTYGGVVLLFPTIRHTEARALWAGLRRRA